MQTATAWAADAARLGVDEAIADAATISVARIGTTEPRPRGPRFGTLVHAVLASIALDASPGAIARTAETQGRIIGATREEVAAAARAAEGVLSHDLMARVRASSQLRRETPVSWMLEDGTLVEGVLDLAFDEGERTIVIDFKTDYELSAGEARYRAQLQQYLGAVTRATGRPAEGILVCV